MVVTHKTYPMPEDPCYLPVQAGAAIHERLPYASDAEGDSISGKNRTFCELTALYWAAFILELKVSKSVDEALEQINFRDYSASLAPYSGKKLAVAICYDADSEDKKHFVKIEDIE